MKKKIQKNINKNKKAKNIPSFRYGLALLLAAAFLLRLIAAYPAIRLGDEETLRRFSRPDTPGYLAPALALAVDGQYLNGPGGQPDVIRAPGFPVFASLFYSSGKLWTVLLVLALIAVSTASTGAVYWGTKAAAGERAALIAAGLHALSLTAIANAPMLLSDTLFSLIAALQLYFFVLFYQKKRILELLISIAFAALGALIRPINVAWIFPALFLILTVPQTAWKKKILYAVCSAAVFYGILFPWMLRNKRCGAGYCIDTNTGAMYYQNGAMLLAAAEGGSYEMHKARMIAELDREFTDTVRYPTPKSRVDYQLAQFRELIRKYPVTWLGQHFQWRILLPDAPVFFENLGLTSSDRGTLSVLQKDGVFAAVRFYFAGKLYLLWLLLPLLAVCALTYALAAGKLLHSLFDLRNEYYVWLWFLAFAEYYLFLPGPITAPRYQLPALPMLCLLAGWGLDLLLSFKQKSQFQKSMTSGFEK